MSEQKKSFQSLEAHLCVCGCGTEIPHQNKYAHGHNGRGKKHSKEWSTNQSAGLKDAWRNGQKFQTMRNQSPELVKKRLAKFGGKMNGLLATRAPDFAAKISASLRGRKLSEEHRLKISKTWLSGPKNLSPEAEERRRKAISLQRKGSHNYGRAARDRKDHFKALH